MKKKGITEPGEGNMFRDVMIGVLALVLVITVIILTYDTAAADNRIEERRILTRDYVLITAENEEGVSVIVTPPGEEIKSISR